MLNACDRLPFGERNEGVGVIGGTEDEEQLLHGATKERDGFFHSHALVLEQQHDRDWRCAGLAPLQQTLARQFNDAELTALRCSLWRLKTPALLMALTLNCDRRCQRIDSLFLCPLDLFYVDVTELSVDLEFGLQTVDRLIERDIGAQGEVHARSAGIGGGEQRLIDDHVMRQLGWILGDTRQSTRWLWL